MSFHFKFKFSSSFLFEKTIKKLKCKLYLKILWKIKRLLGVTFERKIKLYVYTNQALFQRCMKSLTILRFQLDYCSLIEKRIVLSKTDSPTTKTKIQEMNKLPFCSLIGCLTWIASRIRTDVNFALKIFFHFQETPAMIHWNFLLKILC